jgi:hypothetical protein
LFDLIPTKQYQDFAASLCLVVIVLIPIALITPTMLVFIPPSMTLAPASIPCCLQFPALVVRLLAGASVFPYCLVKFVVRMLNSALASVNIFCPKVRHCCVKQNRCQNE